MLMARPTGLRYIIAMMGSVTDTTQWAIGIDVGGSKIEGALVNSRGQAKNTIRFKTPKSYDDCLAVLVGLVKKLTPGRQKILGLGLSIPGSIDPRTELLRNAPNSPAINGTRFFEELKKRLPLRLKIENDANCLILSELKFGVARGYKNAVGLIMGTGFGSGVITNGKLLKGSSGLAPELGHSILDVAGRLCLCGNRGCVEAYLSGPSILKRYHEAGGNRVITKTEDVFKNAKQDLVAQNILATTKYLFSRFAASLVSLYDPEIIVLGGGLSRQKMYYTCVEEIRPHVFGSRQVPIIAAARHGDASGKLGAAALWF